jgi:hypothetical protein
VELLIVLVLSTSILEERDFAGDVLLMVLHSWTVFGMHWNSRLQALAAAPDYFAGLFSRLRSCDRDSAEMKLLVQFLQVRITMFPSASCANVCDVCVSMHIHCILPHEELTCCDACLAQS